VKKGHLTTDVNQFKDSFEGARFPVNYDFEKSIPNALFILGEILGIF
jgi:hypothetical protein